MPDRLGRPPVQMLPFAAPEAEEVAVCRPMTGAGGAVAALMLGSVNCRTTSHCAVPVIGSFTSSTWPLLLNPWALQPATL